jgi:ATP adenylyltransferase
MSRHLWSPWRLQYIQQHERPKGCFLCRSLRQEDGPENLIVYRGKLSFVILNRYPYNNGHLMIAPMVHKPDFNELDTETRAEMIELVSNSERTLRNVYQPAGFNIGANIGSAAGAGLVGHLHIHIVPRWSGDTNFMSTLAETRVLPEELGDTLKKITIAWT